MIRILLCGANGKMGHVIASCVAERGNMEIVAGIDLNIKTYDAFPIYKDFASCDKEADVIIDFSTPAILDNLLSYAKRTKTPVVAATTRLYAGADCQASKRPQNRPPCFSLSICLLASIF